MGRTDLGAVAARRAEIARDLDGLELKRVELAAEDAELDVTERVLKRIERLLRAETAFAYSTNYVVEGPIHRRAIGMIRTLMGGRNT